MIFKVEQLGPVKRAEIDLRKDLILLTGPNGTGKTYVAWAIYGFLQGWRDVLPLLALPQQDLERTAERLLERGESQFDLAALIDQYGSDIVAETARLYGERLAEEFAAEKRIFGNSRIQIEAGNALWLRDESGVGAGWLGSVNIRGLISRRVRGSSIIQLAFIKSDPDGTQANAFHTTGAFSENIVPLGQIPDRTPEFRRGLINMLMNWLADARSRRNSIIFPAERISTTVFWRELALKRTELVDEVLAMKDQPAGAVLEHVRSSAQRYPRPIQDSLRMAADLERWSRKESQFGDLADYMEEHLLLGKVRLSSHGGLEFVPAQRSDVVLGVHITASMVKSLSLLVFYLRHMAEQGDIVIIDEPELNLHPDNQRMIARVLARAVNRGLKIVASTHSDYLMRELNHLILLAQDKEEIRALREKLGYEEAELLKPEQLGVYLFRNDAPEVASVPVDEMGFAVPTIEAEINKLNAVSQQIYAILSE